MYLRDFQIYAPYESRERNVQLSVISEVIVLWLRNRPLVAAPIMKLLISVHSRPDTWRGPAWIVGPDGIGELRITDDRVARTAEVRAAAIEAIRAGFERASLEGVDLDPAVIHGEILPLAKLPSPHEVQLRKLSFQDPSTGHPCTVWYIFDEGGSRIEIRRAARPPIGVVSSPSFHSLATLFPATQRRVRDREVVFLTGSGVELAKVVLPLASHRS